MFRKRIAFANCVELLRCGGRNIAKATAQMRGSLTIYWNVDRNDSGSVWQIDVKLEQIQQKMGKT